jgi:hypothetical protein
MKKLYILAAFVLLGMSSFAQTLKFKITDAETKTNLNGNPINKGDEFEISVWVNPNGNTTARSLYFDFEYQNTAFQLMSVAHTGTNGNGGALPTGSSISMNYQDYPGYSWLSTQQNNSVDGNVKYNNANYTYTGGGPKSILRVYLNWATNNTNFAEWHLIKLRLKSNIASDMFGTNEMFQIYNDSNEILQRALEILKNKEYDKVKLD